MSPIMHDSNINTMEQQKQIQTPPGPLNKKQFLKHNYIIFDWDDTLLPSTALMNAGITLQSVMMNKEVYNQFRQHEIHVIKILQRAITLYAKCYIITNAETGWVELSAAKFMPNVVPLLNNIIIISARSMFQEYNINNANIWKTMAFRARVLALVNPKTELNIISFGDSECERNALLSISYQFKSARTKNIKFITGPTIEQLTRQLEMIVNNFQFLFQHDGNLDLMLTITQHARITIQPPTNEMVSLPDVMSIVATDNVPLNELRMKQSQYEEQTYQILELQQKQYEEQARNLSYIDKILEDDRTKNKIKNKYENIMHDLTNQFQSLTTKVAA